MPTLKQAAAEFLSQNRIAVVGVSRDAKQSANANYRRLKARGYQVFAVNPHADLVEGDRCYRSLREIEGGVDGVLVFTPRQASAAVVQECAELHIPRVWLHRSVDAGSVSEEAVAIARREGIAVLDGACPMMFLGGDPAHACMRFVLGLMGKLPDGSEYRLQETLPLERV